MNVHGNRAIIGYYGATVEGPFISIPFTYRGLVEVIDNGPASALRDGLEILTLDVPHDYPGYVDEPITTCPSTLPAPGVGAAPLTAPPAPGDDNFARSDVPQDFTVTDAHRLPISKEECKHGGWRNYPGFKNQGDCVSFVATGGKNPPTNSP